MLNLEFIIKFVCQFFSDECCNQLQRHQTSPRVVSSYATGCYVYDGKSPYQLKNTSRGFKNYKFMKYIVKTCSQKQNRKINRRRLATFLAKHIF